VVFRDVEVFGKGLQRLVPFCWFSSNSICIDRGFDKTYCSVMIRIRKALRIVVTLFLFCSAD